jgi:hypothetical protein
LLVMGQIIIMVTVQSGIQRLDFNLTWLGDRLGQVQQ